MARTPKTPTNTVLRVSSGAARGAMAEAAVAGAPAHL